METRTAESMVCRAKSMTLASAGSSSWLSRAMDTWAMAAAIFSGVSGGARSKVVEAFSCSERMRTRSAGIPRRQSRTSASEDSAMASGTSSSSR